jgi:hypothetical protein
MRSARSSSSSAWNAVTCGGHRRRQHDRARASAPAGEQQPADQPEQQRRQPAVEDQLGGAVRVLERDRRVLALALRVGLVGQQAADGERRRRDLDRLHRAVGREVGDRERRHLGLADREVLQGDREDLPKPWPVDSGSDSSTDTRCSGSKLRPSGRLTVYPAGYAAVTSSLMRSPTCEGSGVTNAATGDRAVDRGLVTAGSEMSVGTAAPGAGRRQRHVRLGTAGRASGSPRSRATGLGGAGGELSVGTGAGSSNSKARAIIGASSGSAGRRRRRAAFASCRRSGSTCMVERQLAQQLVDAGALAGDALAVAGGAAG